MNSRMDTTRLAGTLADQFGLTSILQMRIQTLLEEASASGQMFRALGVPAEAVVDMLRSLRKIP